MIQDAYGDDLSNLCPFEYRGHHCGYLGQYPGACGKRFADCRRRGNQERFGGVAPGSFRGLPSHRQPAPPKRKAWEDLDGFRGVLVALLGVLIIGTLFFLGLFA
jgi:hypothetical protein